MADGDETSGTAPQPVAMVPWGKPFQKGYDPRRRVPRPLSELTPLRRLRDLVREGGEGIVGHLFEIVAFIPITETRRDESGVIVTRTVGPSHSERIAASKLLLAYGYGQPVHRVQVGGDEDPPARMDLSKLTIEELRALDAMMKKAQP